jgi:hypothetical protein
LQADEVKDAAMRGIFQDVIYRVRSMAMVHEKLYQSTDLSRVDFATTPKAFWDICGEPRVRQMAASNSTLNWNPFFCR